jgi:hypothetical protein
MEAAFKWMEIDAVPVGAGTSTITRVIPHVHESTKFGVEGRAQSTYRPAGTAAMLNAPAAVVTVLVVNFDNGSRGYRNTVELAIAAPDSLTTVPWTVPVDRGIP